ncbi:MAG: cation diffusion facilitator family transporter [Candidatus Helarchaeota archaeon]
MKNPQLDKHKLRIKAALISIIIQIFLLSLKLVVGIFTNSLSIIALAADSGFDLIASFATYWGIIQIMKPADLDHSYGHGKYEFLVSGAQAFILFITAGIIVIDAIFRLLYGAEVLINIYSFIVMIIGIIANVFLNNYLSRVSKETNSLALEANAINSLSDILNYIIVFVSLFFILFFKMQILDAIIAMVISFMVVYGGIKLIKKSIEGLLDKVPNDVKIDRVKEIVESIQGVVNAHSIRLRASGPYVFMDLHVNVESIQSVKFSHFLTEMIEKSIKKEFPSVTDVLVHIEPVRTISPNFKNEIREKILKIKEIKRCHHIHFGSTENRLFLDCHVVLDKLSSLDYVHNITKKIEKEIKIVLKEDLNINDIDILVHAEPYDDVKRKELISDIINIVKNFSIVKDCYNVKVIVEEENILCTIHVILTKNMELDKAHEISEMIEKIVGAKLKQEFKEKEINITTHFEPCEVK